MLEIKEYNLHELMDFSLLTNKSCHAIIEIALAN